jgi:hypothetical protein
VLLSLENVMRSCNEITFLDPGTPAMQGVTSGSRFQLNCDNTRRRTGGEVKGILAKDWVASTLHTTSEHGVSSITTADAHISAASSRLN